MKIITNNVPRDIIEAHELTIKEVMEFDYLDWEAIERGEDSASFFRYKGELYDLGEIEVAPDVFKAQGYDGYQSDSYFSGLVVRYVNDNEQVIIGRYME